MGIEFKDEHLEKLTEADTRSKENSNRIDKLEGNIKSLEEQNHTLYDMAASVKVLSEGVGSIKEDVKEIKKDQSDMKSEIQDIKNTPVKTKAGWFDTIGKVIVTVVVTGIIAFVCGQLCPTIFN